jgi:hypothetical protein
MEKAINFIAWSVITCLGSMVIYGLVYAAIQIAIGNVHSTASFEF